MRQHKLAATFAVAAVAGLVFTGASASAASGGGGGSTGQKTSTMYDAVPVPLVGNMPSWGFEATQTRQFGDAIEFAPGSNRNLRTVTVTLSSWGCEQGAWQLNNCVTTPGATFTHPITFNVYEPDGSTLLGSKTQTFTIPFRPSASPKCTGDKAGRWWDSSRKTCYNGYATNVTFAFADVVLPDKVVYGIEYNTTTAGYAPIGAAACNADPHPFGCGYDALNVGLNTTTGVIIGAQTNPGEVWMDSLIPGNYCDGGIAGTFRRDTAGNACWVGYVPAVQFKGASK